VRIRVILAIGLVALASPTIGEAGDPAHVACVGDSITFGVGASKPYPQQLQALLGAAYAVQNDGHSGATLLNAGDIPYPKVAEYAASTAWAGDVVIMLGTNDSKPYNWSHKADFEGDCAKLVEHYQSLPSKPRVWLNLPTPAFSNPWGITGSVITNEVIPALKRCAAARGISTIDVNAAFAGQSTQFPDGVHPNDAGAAIIATAVRDALVKQPSISISAVTTQVTATPVVAYGKVERVELFEGSESRGVATAAPWVLTVKAQPGSHSYYAVVTETGGRTAKSGPVTIVGSPLQRD
jgi:lysophospholipase L1-like esterase